MSTITFSAWTSTIASSGDAVQAIEEVPVVSFTTGRGEASLQWRAERIAAELARGQWLFPSLNGKRRDKETALLAKDLLHYTPIAHCPDGVAARAFAQWGCEQGEARAEVGFVDLLSR